MATLTLPTNNQFLNVLRQSGLLSAETLHKSLNQAGELPADSAKLATLFIQDGLLTRFQARLLLQGRPRKFFLGGKFKILDQLGQGGMGAVYLCEHLMMRRLVAVKVISTLRLDDPSLLERFFREARAVASLNHPNLVRAFDADKDGDLHYLVMEFVDGVSLQQLVAARGPLDPVRAAHCVAQTALGLQHAHEAGWIHRDIKPGNILLDRTGLVKLLDLGLARLFADKSDNLTQKFDDHATLGTADYLAPEQAMDLKSVDIRGDLYSLGASFYFLLTGRAPFADKENTAQKLVAHQMLKPPPLAELRPDVPKRLVGLIEQLMEKDPNDRLHEPIEVVRALEPWTRQPIDPPSAEEMPKWPKAIAELAGRSDPTLSGAAQSQTPTVTNRGQRTQPMTPPAKASTNAASSASSKKLASASSVRLRPKKKKQKAEGLPPLLVVAVIGGFLLVATATAVWFAWPASELPTAPSRDPRFAFSDGSRPAGGDGRRTPDEAGSKTTPAAPSTAPALNPKTTLFVAANAAGAPAGASRVFPTVRAALQQAKAGDTVAVVDELIRELLILDDGSLGRRVSVVSARPDGKSVVWQPPTGHEKAPIVQLSALEGFTLRGFQFDGNDDQVDSLIAVQGRCPGVRLEDLHLTQFRRVGIELKDAQGETDQPIALRRLRIESGKKNQRLAALSLETANPSGECKHVLLADSRAEGFFQCMVRISGSATFAAAHNNRFLILPPTALKAPGKVHVPSDAFYLENAAKLRLSIANNTFLRFYGGVRLASLPPAHPDNRVTFRNNLILNMQACVVVGEGGGAAADEAGAVALFPGFEGNLCRPNSCGKGLPALTPTVKDDIDRLSDSPEDDRTFLLYPKNSKLMTAGAGGEPVGAVR